MPETRSTATAEAIAALTNGLTEISLRTQSMEAMLQQQQKLIAKNTANIDRVLQMYDSIHVKVQELAASRTVQEMTTMRRPDKQPLGPSSSPILPTPPDGSTVSNDRVLCCTATKPPDKQPMDPAVVGKEHKVKSVKARQLIDSKGNPIVEVDLVSDDLYRSAVPSGASIGIYEALELRDGDKSVYGGNSVLQAVRNINQVLGPKLIGVDVRDQAVVDALMLELDGTPNKSKFGANVILGVSLSVCRVGAGAKGVPLYKHIQEISGTTELVMPVPAFNVINGIKIGIDVAVEVGFKNKVSFTSFEKCISPVCEYDCEKKLAGFGNCFIIPPPKPPDIATKPTKPPDEVRPPMYTDGVVDSNYDVPLCFLLGSSSVISVATMYNVEVQLFGALPWLIISLYGFIGALFTLYQCIEVFSWLLMATFVDSNSACLATWEDTDLFSAWSLGSLASRTRLFRREGVMMRHEMGTRS